MSRKRSLMEIKFSMRNNLLSLVYHLRQMERIIEGLKQSLEELTNDNS